MRWFDGIINSMDMHLNVHQELGDDEGQGSLACCSPCSRKESDMTDRLNNKITFKFNHYHLIYVLKFSFTCINIDMGGR